jgi:uncharacterized protein (TIGR02680 family)
VAAAAAAHERVLHDERAELSHARARVDAERAPLEDERRRLEADEDRPPDPLPFRAGAREGRPGAPLWAVVDFAAELDDASRAGVEGALEGAALLDAWVLPDGDVVDADDAALVPGTAVMGTSLGAVLQPAPGAGVPEHVTAGILARIGWEAGGAALGDCAVAADGRYALGPLRGRHRVSTARYIGATARAAHRAARLAELAAALSALETRARALEGDLAALDSRLARVAVELASFPDETPAVRAYHGLDRARAEEERARARPVEEDAALGRAAEAREAAHRRALDHAREYALPGPDEPAGLERVDRALAAYREGITVLTAAELLRRDRAESALSGAQRLARAHDTGTLAAERRTETRRRAEARAAAHREAETAVGASVEALRERLAELEARQATIEAQLKTLGAERERAAEADATARAARAAAAAALADAEAGLERALAALRRLDLIDAWRLALGAGMGPGDDLSLEGALAALRGVAREALATRRGLETLIADVDREADELRHRLAGTADYHVARERPADDLALTVVTVRHGGRPLSVTELMDWLQGELDARSRTLAEEDRRIFEGFLVGGLADALRTRISDAGRLVAAMNARLATCATSSQMKVELQWRPREHDDPGLGDAVALLRRDAALLRDDARERLVEFMRRRIDEARASLALGATVDHVMAALDYRAWHEFRVIQVKEGRRDVLTKRRHQQGSGGEKAVALHLPLFAAAAAQFATCAPHAPRLILLDEAFAGIDEHMRGQLLGLLEAFDLDFVLTSHELWGCYPELGALGIYHLHREPGVPGVASAHFTWDGRRRIEVVAA